MAVGQPGAAVAALASSEAAAQAPQSTPSWASIPDPLAKARELHRSVPPEMWCIRRKDLRHFVCEVRRALAEGRIPEDPLHPNPDHFNPKIGPTMHSVSEHYLKPVTLEAGGMSYALMLNPKGLPCDVFVTHAWAEGVFEFADKVLHGWPVAQQHLWCCCLALPQNLSITALLDVPLLQTPFAKALRAASLVVVVPNSTVSIYSRLWCVFEAYLATKAGKIMVMPSLPSTSKLRKAIAGVVFVPSVVGWLLGFVCSEVTLVGGITAEEGFGIDNMARMLVTTTIVKMVVSLGYRGKCGMHVHACKVISVLITTGHSVMDVYWLQLQCRGLVTIYPFADLFLLLVSLTRFLLPCWETTRWLQDMQVESQARQLGMDFEGVHHATCSNEEDERRIRHYIAGSEGEVDAAINVLMKAGAYSHCLQTADSLGLNISNWGHTHVSSLTIGGLVLWTLTLFVCSNACYLVLWQTGWEASPPASLIISISTVCGTALALPLLAWMSRWDRSRRIFACRAWFFGATSALIGTMGVLGVPRIVASVYQASGSISEYEGQLTFRALVLFWPAACAFASLLLAMLGEAILSGVDAFWRAIANKEAPTPLDWEEDLQGASSPGETSSGSEEAHSASSTCSDEV